ncbi:MAG: flagellar protein export ATPase FliI [Bacteroidetes bacterium]|nr:flagellar protein export ATPase FliI [Bacteroidota bacterium]MCL5738238.1 flagellar protein export ATPase FliI [Bacteroidota bacterium]
MSAVLEHIEKYIDHLNKLELVKVNGRVSEVIGLVIESVGPTSSLGDVCSIKSRGGEEICLSEVVGFRRNRVLSMVLGSASSISPGSEIVASGKTFSVGVGMNLLGRVLDGLGRPMDRLGPVEHEEVRSIYSAPPNPLERKRISQPISSGIRSIDALLTIGKGQRIGIFAGSGVGKSVTLGMIARNSSADVNVIALVGERGREVRDFIEKELGEEGLKKSVLVVATSDQASLIRVKASLIATTIAEYFRDKGLDVLLMMDSVTRVAMAQREVGLTIGEPPTTKGYTPSVFALLPRLLERAGNAKRGSITGMYTVLVEGDDMNEPIADAARSILDGHIVLSRKLASAGHYPAVDALESVSRVMPDVTTPEHRKAASYVTDLLATHREAEDLINIGAYVKGSSQKIDKAVAMIDQIRIFLKQGIEEVSVLDDAIRKLMELTKV